MLTLNQLDFDRKQQISLWNRKELRLSLLSWRCHVCQRDRFQSISSASNGQSLSGRHLQMRLHFAGNSALHQSIALETLDILSFGTKKIEWNVRPLFGKNWPSARLRLLLFFPVFPNFLFRGCSNRLQLKRLYTQRVKIYRMMCIRTLNDLNLTTFSAVTWCQPSRFRTGGRAAKERSSRWDEFQETTGSVRLEIRLPWRTHLARVSTGKWSGVECQHQTRSSVFSAEHDAQIRPVSRNCRGNYSNFRNSSPGHKFTSCVSEQFKFHCNFNKF